MIFSNNFAQEIEDMCNSNDNVSYIDAIVSWCDKNRIEVEVAAHWVKKEPTLRAKLQNEAENLNILKKGARLPI